MSRQGYLRFVVSDLDMDSGRRLGPFLPLHDLHESGAMSPAEQATYREVTRWFARRLRVPDRFARSRRPHACYRAISWFKDGADEHIRRMRELVSILKAHGIPVHVLCTRRPGYVVYEDEHQVAAEPYADSGA